MTNHVMHTCDACNKNHSNKKKHATTCKIVLSVLTPFIFNKKLLNPVPGIHSKLGKLQALQISNLNMLY